VALEDKKASNKKPGPPKCRGCSGLVDLKEVIIVGGNKWHRRCAEQKKKHVPKEYAS